MVMQITNKQEPLAGVRVPGVATGALPPGSGVPLEERWFEDYAAGETFVFGDHPVTENEIIAFASRYDPQSFHVDPVAARESPYGGLIASGWMTAALVMKMMCAHFISTVSALGSPGVENLRWLRPVRPGDRLRVRVTVLEARHSASKPDRGTLNLRQEAINQDGQVVMSLEGRSMHRCRPAPTK
jgi:acyl dehydratase